MEKGFDERAGRLLRPLYDRRSHADHDLGPVPREVAEEAMEDAAAVAGIFSDWLEQRSP